MTEAVLEQTEQTTQTPEQEEADFNKGFGAAPEQSAPAQKTEEKKEDPKTEGAAAETETPKADDPADKGTLINGVPEADWNAAVAKAIGPVADELRKEIRKNFGQVGDVQRGLNELKAAKGAPAASRKITAELLKRVNEELPGLGAALAEDLSGIFGGAEEAQAKAEAQGKAFDEEKYFKEKVAPALSEIEARTSRSFEQKLLRYAHPDYQTVVYSDPKAGKWTPEFDAWVKTLPADRQVKVSNSEDAIEVAGFVTEFKTWNEKAKKDKDSKNKRLESALTPKGVPNAPGHKDNDEDADFNKGFKEAGKKYAR